ncbi:LytR/AlgR family response regulator transcription factor [Roseisolibacter agri]|uniref:DNA-binding response regulator n=1 Tax=Roseisolibacter agri TaxID=2014610 RepID=A0AA37Q4R7_9BACT|nr:LytTR family DNA-binding domain-containing protein [Roseisolibacter agri]GLC24592.1 DNA-binding response regulator [Roseisolibacter agri]
MSEPLRVLVVDDEAPARRKLARLLSAMPDVALAGEAETGAEAVERIGALTPDLVLLDVQMPVLDGFGVVAAVGVGAMPPVVFVTAHDEHALRAFEVRALDYLLKPVTAERLREAIDRVRSRPRTPAAEAERAARLQALDAPPAPVLRHLLVQDAQGARLLSVEDVELARAERNYVALHTATGTFRVRGTIGELAARLDPARFLRVNRSDVVRLDAIRELQPWSHGDYRIVLRDGSALLWSRRFRAEQAGAFELG